MAEFRATFANCLRDGHWAFGVIAKENAIGLRLKFKEQTYPVEIEFREEERAKTIIGRVFYTRQITASAQQNLAEFTSFVNFELKYGGLELDGSPYVKFRESAAVAGLTLTSEFVTDFIIGLVENAAKLENAVMAVLNGDLPGDAIHLIQQ
jgi:hypothetical protein